MRSRGITGLYSSFILSLLRKLHAVLHSGCTNSHSHNNARGFPFSIPSPTFIVCRFFDDGHSDSCEVIFHCSFDLCFSNNEQC